MDPIQHTEQIESHFISVQNVLALMFGAVGTATIWLKAVTRFKDEIAKLELRITNRLSRIEAHMGIEDEDTGAG